jgi:benzoylformate decarboxylase
MTVMTGRKALMQIFLREKVEYIFGLPGATEVEFLAAVEDTPEIKYFLGLHETTVIGMAEGYARTSGKAGIINLHTSTGLAAALPLLVNAMQGGVPLIITAGQQDTRLAAQEPQLRSDLVKIATPFTKWATEIVNAEEIPIVMRRAFREALHPPTGPVFVSLPQNILQESLDLEYSPLSNLYSGSHPDPEAVRVAADLLVKGGSPIMIVEDGVTKSEALEEVVQLAELIGARVYQPWMSDVNFPVNHPLYAGDLEVNSASTRQMLELADPLIVIGAPIFAQVKYMKQPLLQPGTKIIQIDNNPWQIGKNFPVTSGIEGNIKVAVRDLINTLQKSLTAEDRDRGKKRINSIRNETEKVTGIFREKMQKEADNTPIAPTRLMEEIRRAIKPGTRVVDDCWSYSSALRYILGFSEAKSYQRSRGGGSIGWGLSGALGVKLASPDRPVVCISGDGSAIWSIQSLWTAARYQIPVTYIICANAIYRQVRIIQKLFLGEDAINRHLGTDIGNPRIDFCGLAKSLGIPATKVEHPEELSGALRSALNSSSPTLVEVYVDGTVPN